MGSGQAEGQRRPQAGERGGGAVRTDKQPLTWATTDSSQGKARPTATGRSVSQGPGAGLNPI